MIVLLLEVQFIKNFNKLDLNQPALMDIVFEKIETIIEFKFLNPNFILKMIDPRLSIGVLLGLEQTDDASDLTICGMIEN